MERCLDCLFILFSSLSIAGMTAAMLIERWWSTQGLACRKEGKKSVGNLSSLASYYNISIYL